MTEVVIIGEIGDKTYTADEPYRLNLRPVEEFGSKLEKALDTEQNRRDRKSVDLVKYFLDAAREMNKEQLEYLVNNLVAIVEKWAFLYQYTSDNPEEHLKTIQDYRKIEEMMR